MAVTARKYNPGFLTDDELVASFCVRTVEFEMLAEALRECTGPSNPHQIVIGPRGSGKTSLLLRIAVEVRGDAELAAGLFPVVFAEESYEVATAGEFWLECLSRVAAQAPRREDAPDLHSTFKELRTVRDDRELADRCLGAVLDFSDREGKRLVLMVENLDMMFRDMADADAGWRLRKVLQTEPRIVLLASATSRFDEIDDPKHALYDLFSVRTLRPLDTSECATLWEAVAGRCPQHGTIRSIEILTGGSPRLIAIVARFGAELSFRKLMASLLNLIDDHTEYFKSHLELLPSQERRVYLSLATLWKPATTREISEQARMETSKCSAQLTRLIGRGVVRSAGGSARRKQYYLTERLYNIYYLLRRDRRADRLVEALVHFMESYYSPSELKDIGTRIIREAEGFDAEMQSLSQAALARLMELPAVAGHREELRAIALVNKGHVLRWLNRAADALAAFDEVIRRYEDDQTPEIVQHVAEALARKGDLLSGMNRPHDALAACNEVVRRFGDSESPTLGLRVADALVTKGFVLHQLSETDDALTAYDEVVSRFDKSETSIAIRETVFALVSKGSMLAGLNRYQDSLVVFDEVIRRFGAGDLRSLQWWIEEALLRKADIELKCQLYDAAAETADRVLDQLQPESLGNRVRGHLIRAQATLAKGDRSSCESDVKASLALLPEIDPVPREHLHALIVLGVMLWPEQMCEFIKASPSANLLLPLTTALELELGHEPRVALEVKEVAEDIRRDLARFRGTGSDDINARRR